MYKMAARLYFNIIPEVNKLYKDGNSTLHRLKYLWYFLDVIQTIAEQICHQVGTLF